MTYSEDVKEKVRQYRLGRKHSEDTINKMKLAWKIRKEKELAK